MNAYLAEAGIENQADLPLVRGIYGLSDKLMQERITKHAASMTA